MSTTRETRALEYARRVAQTKEDLRNIIRDYLAGAQGEAAILDEAIAVLKEIANEDYRGNRSSGSVKAYQVLKKLGYME